MDVDGWENTDILQEKGGCCASRGRRSGRRGLATLTSATLFCRRGYKSNSVSCRALPCCHWGTTAKRGQEDRTRSTYHIGYSKMYISHWTEQYVYVSRRTEQDVFITLDRTRCRCHIGQNKMYMSYWTEQDVHFTLERFCRLGAGPTPGGGGSGQKGQYY